MVEADARSVLESGHRLGVCRCIVGMQQVKAGRPDERLGGHPEDLLGRWRDVENMSAHVVQRDEIRRVLDDELVELLPMAERGLRSPALSERLLEGSRPVLHRALQVMFVLSELQLERPPAQRA